MNQRSLLLRDVRAKLFFFLYYLFSPLFEKKNSLLFCSSFSSFWHSNGFTGQTAKQRQLRSIISGQHCPHLCLQKKKRIKTDWKNQNAVDNAACGKKTFGFVCACVFALFIWNRSILCFAVCLWVCVDNSHPSTFRNGRIHLCMYSMWMAQKHTGLAQRKRKEKKQRAEQRRKSRREWWG